MKEKWTAIFNKMRSMRIQVFTTMFLAGIIPVILFSNIIIKAYNSQIITQRTDEIQSYATVIANLVLSSGFLSGESSDEVNRESEEIANIYQGRVMIIDQNLRIIKDTYNVETGKTAISTEVIQCMNGSKDKYTNTIGDYIQLTSAIVDPSTEKVTGAVLISFSTKSLAVLEDSVNYRAILIILALAICIVLFSFLYSALLSNPLQKVTESIDEVTRGDFDVALDIHSYSELESVSESFNRMIGFIQEQDNARQEFASNVSHELKTPLTSMKVLSDSLLSQEGMPEELYREFLGDITSEIERMTNIINDLLSMAKLEKNSADMTIVNISINELLDGVLKRLRPIAAKRNIELVYESYRPVVADVDEVKMSIALNNLIENAIKYNREQGKVNVILDADHQFFTVQVADTGIGIPEDSIQHIYERFYRVDKSHSREIGGTGLGLAITKGAVQLLRGSIKVESIQGEGSVFTVKIPLTRSLA